MHPQSGDIPLVTFGGQEGTDKPAPTVSKSYRGQPKLLCFRLALLQPIGSKVEHKNSTAKLLSFFHRLAGHDLMLDNME